MTEEELQAIEARLQATSKAPWRFRFGTERRPIAKTKAVRERRAREVALLNRYDWVWDAYNRAILGTPMNDILRDRRRTADLEFVAHAREDVPVLLAEVRRLQSNRAKLIEALQDLVDRTLDGDQGEVTTRAHLEAQAILASD